MAKPAELYNLPAEQALVGSIFTNTDEVARVDLVPDDFHDKRHQLIWEVYLRLYERGAEIDQIVVAAELDKMGELATIGGSAYLSALTALPESGHNCAEHASIIKDLAAQRRLMSIATDMAKAAVNSKVGIDTIPLFIEQLSRLLATAEGREASEPSPPAYKTTWSVAELLATDFPAPRWLVDGMIPAGFISIGGKPKAGKSRLVSQLAVAKGSGGYFLGTKVEKGSVLMIAFEDSPQLLKDRFRDFGATKESLITLKTEYRLLEDGGLDDLTLEAYSGLYELIIIDTFGMSVGQVEIKDYAQMIGTLKPLQKLTQHSGVSIVLVDHYGKMGDSGNPVMDLIGSIGKGGTFDVLVGLYREKRTREAKLTVIARTLKDDVELALAIDHQIGCWRSLGEADAVRADTFKGQIIEAIKTLKQIGELATPTKIKNQLGPGVDLGYTSRAIGELLDAGKLIKLEKIGREQPYDLKEP